MSLVWETLRVLRCSFCVDRELEIVGGPAVLRETFCLHFIVSVEGTNLCFVVNMLVEVPRVCDSEHVSFLLFIDDDVISFFRMRVIKDKLAEPRVALFEIDNEMLMCVVNHRDAVVTYHLVTDTLYVVDSGHFRICSVLIASNPSSCTMIGDGSQAPPIALFYATGNNAVFIVNSNKKMKLIANGKYQWCGGWLRNLVLREAFW